MTGIHDQYQVVGVQILRIELAGPVIQHNPARSGYRSHATVHIVTHMVRRKT